MELATLRWSPSENTRADSNISHYIEWLRVHRQLVFRGYDDLWKWSVTDVDVFWKSIWEYFGIIHEGKAGRVSSGEMPDVTWFDGTTLNYAEHIFRKESENPAIIFGSESQPATTLSWKQLRNQTSSFQHLLLKHGVGKGDTVAGYLPCIPEATAAMLAAVGIGAVWSSASPDFCTQAVIERFQQIQPKILIAVDHYNYGGKSFDKTEVIEALTRSLPSLVCIVVITSKEYHPKNEKVVLWTELVSPAHTAITFVRVPFSHPLWVLYSSGTTGMPKAITHSHGGILIEQLKYATFHNDFRPGERCFWYTTTGWMMWNYIHGSLLCGATMVLYDGSPGYPDLNVLWKFAAEARIHHFGTSAAFILANMKAGVRPKEKFSFEHLRSIGSTGSTLPPEGFDWIYDNIKSDLWLASMSGGTDVCSAFVGGNPTWPVYAGEIQCRALGCSLEAFDEDGRSVIDEEGEMVITKPMPSMPVFFWGDTNFQKYKESYFEMYPGIWRHGDWIRITPRQGIVIYGRSDATLNRGGIRIGTSEIYRAVDHVKEIRDSLIVCIEKKGGEFWMPLFVVMHEGHTLTTEIINRVNKSIRDANSPRHVPDEILSAPDIPYTISGKKTETPVKKILMGKDPAKVINQGSLRNPSSMDYFIEVSRTRRHKE